MSEQDKLRAAIKKHLQALQSQVDQGLDTIGVRHEAAEEFALILRAAESTLPKTKKVEVWRLEYALTNGTEWHPTDQVFTDFMKMTEREGYMLLNPSWFACVRRTGPHQIEVPI